MKRSCNFRVNPAFAAGLALMWTGSFVTNVLEVQGALYHAAHFICGAGVGVTFMGLLYGSPKTRPLFDKFHTFKLRLLGRGSAD